MLRSPLAPAGAIALIVGLSACAARPRVAHDNGIVYEAGVTEGIQRLRAATRPFHVLDSAVTAGYPRDVSDCLVHEQHGAMGYHHMNRDYLDDKIEIERPEILLYERLAHGQYRLNGVEFIVPYRAWPRDSAAPVLMGQRLRQEDRLKFWYLHVWAWTENADGLFADFHPAVTCPAHSRKVYTPFSDSLP